MVHDAWHTQQRTSSCLLLTMLSRLRGTGKLHTTPADVLPNSCMGPSGCGAVPFGACIATSQLVDSGATLLVRRSVTLVRIVGITAPRVLKKWSNDAGRHASARLVPAQAGISKLVRCSVSSAAGTDAARSRTLQQLPS